MQSQDEGFALIPPAATTEPSSGAPAGPEENLRFEDAQSSGGDPDQGFVQEEDGSLEKDYAAYSGRKDFTASDRAGVQENRGSNDEAKGREKDVEKPTHVMEAELAKAQEETREAKQKALALSANHEKVKQNLHQADNAFQNAGGEFAADAIAVAQAEAEAADTPTSVPESVPEEVGEEGDAQKNEEREEQAEGAAEGDGSADEKNEEGEGEAEGAEAGDGSAAELNEEKEEEAVGAEQEKEVAEVMAGEVGAAPVRPQREGKGVIAKRYSDSSFKPPRGIVKPVAQSGKKP